MKRPRQGFTLIEVALFLVITGALFISVTVGVQNSIYQQRFNDSVQSFTEFLRNVYASVMNVENVGNGRTEKAIYGKLVTFGETSDINGSTSGGADANRIYSYDIIGNVGDIGTGNVLDTLSELNANVIMSDGNRLSPVGIIETYTPKWMSRIEPPCTASNCEYQPLVGALLIVRHPRSGIVNTFVMKNQTIEVNTKIRSVEDSYQAAIAQKQAATTEAEKAAAENRIREIASGKVENILKPYLSSAYFKIEDVDFCVNPEGDTKSTIRRDIRIVAGARNASSIEIISDGIDNRCISKD